MPDKTFLGARKTGGLGLRINVEGLQTEMTSKMTPEQKVFHDSMMGSELYREIILLFAQQGAALRNHPNWDIAVEKGAGAGDVLLP